MPPRRVLAHGVLALLTPLALLGWSQPAPSSADEPAADEPAAVEPAAVVSVRRAGKQRVRLEALPRIVQQGGRAANPDDARAAIVATFRPARVGRRVWLQVQVQGSADGDAPSWTSVATTRQDARGRAQLAWTAAEDGRPLTFRVRTRAVKGLPALASGAVSAARWQDPTWTEEFPGSQLRDVWSHRGRDYVHGSRRSCSKGDPSAVSVGGGAARLSVVKDPDATTRCRIRGRDAVPGRFAYRLNGHIGTQHGFSFRYGVAAARVRFHRMRGQHGAFWLQPTAGMYPGALGSEIDVVEYFGDRHPQGGLATFTHRYDGRRRVSAGGWVPDSASYLASRRDGWSKNYHVFSVQWTPRTLVFRIDGKETARMSGGVSAERQFLILSLIAADYEIPKIKGRHLPQHMYVDWVRVWETGA